MKNVPKSERTHIVFTGKRNAGKSSLINAFTNQELAIVSETPGTTTDPVKKAMELLPYGPVVMVDTAGIDDLGELGEKRISKTLKTISEADFVILVIDGSDILDDKEKELIEHLQTLEIPYTIVINKVDLGVNPILRSYLDSEFNSYFEISCKDDKGIHELKNQVIKLLPDEDKQPLIADLVTPNEVVVLVVPIDLGAPKGRLILPQVQTLREALDENALAMVAKDTELRSALSKLNEPPKLVVTDSQAIMKVTKDVPDEVPLTTFSILMARYKGDLAEYIKGLRKIEELKDGDKILIAEACTHHTQEDDIGRVKIPNWLRNYSKKDLTIDVRNGSDYPANLADYNLIIHCGGCMLTRKAMQVRIKQAKLVDVPIVNYGVAISYLHGAIPRAIKPFEEAIAEWENLSTPV